ncbi:unnamed protein product, partial [Chrysoparadoxa australica]
MPRAPIKVCVRTRPTSSFAHDAIVIDKEAQTVVINKEEAGGDVDNVHSAQFDNKQNSFRFQFHHVLHNAGQDTIYDGLAFDVVQSTLDGVNGTIMSYGQTGSGKTFTMIGDTANYHHRGIAPRSLSHVFNIVAARSETAFNISLTYCEIYNERIFDLLLEPTQGAPRADYTIAEEKNGKGIYIRGLTEVPVATDQQALNLLYSGELMRTTAQHNLNKCSNRSHSILTLYITQRARSGVSEKVVRSKLNLVDLAGSERLKKALDLERLNGRAVSDETIKKESMYINQSLSYLEQCVLALSRKNPGHVPYRQTKLTNVLKDSLGGNCNTLLVACIWGEHTHLEETLSTLRLASRMMKVQNESHAQTILDPAQTLKKQEKIIRDLKQELLMHDALAERSSIAYDSYTPEQQEQLRVQLESYLAAQGPEEEDNTLPSFDSVRQMKEICRIFKSMLQELQEEASRAVMNSGGGEYRRLTPEEGAAPEEKGQRKEDGASFVGEEQDGGGFGLGRAPDNARPNSVDA